MITGEGRAFCAGANLKRPGGADAEAATDPSGMPARPRWHKRDLNVAGHPVFDALSHYPKPLIAAVNGYAIGIGCLIPVCCNFVVASEDAVFSLPQVRHDILPTYGGTLRLARFVGRGHALNMVISGRRVGAEEALEIGLVAAVYAPERLRDEAIALAQDVARAPVVAARLTRESLDLGYDSGLAATEQADRLRELALRDAAVADGE